MELLITLALLIYFWTSVGLMQSSDSDQHEIGCFLMLLLVGFAIYIFYAASVDKTPAKDPCKGLPEPTYSECYDSYNGNSAYYTPSIQW